MSDCMYCRQLQAKKLHQGPCPHWMAPIAGDGIWEMHVGHEYEGDVIVTVNRAESKVTLEPKELYYAPGRWE